MLILLLQEFPDPGAVNDPEYVYEYEYDDDGQKTVQVQVRGLT